MSAAPSSLTTDTVNDLALPTVASSPGCFLRHPWVLTLDSRPLLTMALPTQQSHGAKLERRQCRERVSPWGSAEIHSPTSHTQR